MGHFIYIQYILKMAIIMIYFNKLKLPLDYLKQ